MIVSCHTEMCIFYTSVYEVLSSIYLSIAAVLVVDFVTNDEAVDEDSGTVEVCLERSALTQEQFTVTIKTSTGTAGCEF